MSDAPDETRATAHLPHMDIEIWHCRLPDDTGEQLAISMRAVPSFAAFERLFEMQTALWSWYALAPLQAWQRALQSTWRPWLPAPASEVAPAEKDRRDGEGGRSG